MNMNKGHFFRQTRRQGNASGCNAPTMNLDALARNLQTIKGEHDHQPAKECDIPYHKNVFPQLNHRGREQLIFKSVCIYKIFVQCCRVQ